MNSCSFVRSSDTCQVFCIRFIERQMASRVIVRDHDVTGSNPVGGTTHGQCSRRRSENRYVLLLVAERPIVNSPVATGSNPSGDTKESLRRDQKGTRGGSELALDFTSVRVSRVEPSFYRGPRLSAISPIFSFSSISFLPKTYVCIGNRKKMIFYFLAI